MLVAVDDVHWLAVSRCRTANREHMYLAYKHGTVNNKNGILPLIAESHSFVPLFFNFYFCI